MSGMTRRRLMAFALAGVAALPLAGPGRAQPLQPDEEPLRIVRGFYAAYVTARTGAPSALDLIRPHATADLQRLIDRENACTRRTRQLCALDHDMIVDGQDWRITALRVKAVDARPGAMTVRASFRNFNKPVVVDYSFARNAGLWQITDLVNPDGARRLTTLLRSNR